jgi:hypothetical protein
MNGDGLVKLLVATGRTQGQRANDFSWAIDGELVSCKATTTAEVREIAGTRLDLIQAYGDGLDRQGWGHPDASRRYGR